MQTLQVDILNEKVLAVLEGLAELQHIRLRPIADTEQSNRYVEKPAKSSDTLNQKVEEPLVTGWKSLYGAVSSPSKEDVDAYLQELKDDWE